MQNMATSTQISSRHEISEAEVREQVQRILDSRDFPASDRNRRFLRHVVEQTLLGRRVKAYEIGTQIFGRAVDFNPSTDPIVRIEAGKLRRDLKMYYLKSGKYDPVEIRLRVGAYVADVTRNVSSSAEWRISPQACEIFRTAMLGWAGRYSFDAADRCDLEMVRAMCGADEVLRNLTMEGLKRAASSAISAPC